MFFLFGVVCGFVCEVFVEGVVCGVCYVVLQFFKTLIYFLCGLVVLCQCYVCVSFLSVCIFGHFAFLMRYLVTFNKVTVTHKQQYL